MLRVLELAYHDVDVRRSHGMPVHELEQLVRRPISGQRVRRRVVAVEPVLPVLVGAELAAQVIGRLVVRVLEVVLPVGAGLPDIEDGVGDGLAGQQVGDGAVHQRHLAVLVGVLDDGIAVLAEGGVGRPEGAEDGGGGRVDVALSDDLVGDLIDKPDKSQKGNGCKQSCCNLRLETEHIGDTVRLVTGRGRHLAHGVDEVHTGHPLVVGQLNLTRKVVQVAQQAGEDLAVPGRDVLSHGGDDMVGELGVEAAGRRDGAVELRGARGAIDHGDSVGGSGGRHCEVDLCVAGV